MAVSYGRFIVLLVVVFVNGIESRPDPAVHHYRIEGGTNEGNNGENGGTGNPETHVHHTRTPGGNVNPGDAGQEGGNGNPGNIAGLPEEVIQGVLGNAGGGNGGTGNLLNGILGGGGKGGNGGAGGILKGILGGGGNGGAGGLLQGILGKGGKGRKNGEVPYSGPLVYEDTSSGSRPGYRRRGEDCQVGLADKIVNKLGIGLSGALSNLRDDLGGGVSGPGLQNNVIRILYHVLQNGVAGARKILTDTACGLDSTANALALHLDSGSLPRAVQSGTYVFGHGTANLGRDAFSAAYKALYGIAEDLHNGLGL